MNKSDIVAIMAKNCICTICWIVLAVVFGKWWIALFAVLFLTSYETQHRYYRFCDKCGKHSPIAKSYNEAIDLAKAAGWLYVAEDNKDYCPECKMKVGAKNENY